MAPCPTGSSKGQRALWDDGTVPSMLLCHLGENGEKMRFIRMLLLGGVLLGCIGEEPPSPIEELPADYRSCSVDTDCAVAPSLAGYDHIPGPGDLCREICYIGVREERMSRWREEVAARAPSVSCDQTLKACPPEDHWTARCLLHRCVVVHTPPPPPEAP